LGYSKSHNPQYIFDAGRKNPTTSKFLPNSGDIEKNVRTYLWFVVCGLWFVVCGLWFVVCGLWFVVCGLWFVVCGLKNYKLYYLEKRK
jgi:fatty acid desaturase